MKNVPRDLEGVLRRACRAFPAVVLTGPRRSGKTWLLRHLFPKASYRLIEDPDVVARLRADPQGFLDALETPAILDEIQHAPELLAHLRSRIDAHPRRKGQWLLTGSQEAPLMRGVTESMAGRAAVLQLWPMARHEHRRVSVLLGGFPEVLARPRAAQLWLSSYVQTYLERDVRNVLGVRDLPTFRRFVALLATRHGQVLNKSDFAAPLGVSVPTIGQWLNVLEVTGQVLLVPPYFDNVGKRIIKSPKVYIADSGLACHLLGVSTTAELERSPFLGALLEGFVAAEIAKAQVHAGQRRELFYFRDQQGLEVDFVVPQPGGQVALVEVKATHTPTPSLAAPMQKLARAFASASPPRQSSMTLVCRKARSAPAERTVAPGVKWCDLDEFVLDPLNEIG